MPWASSPSATVWRKRLELWGDAEAGRVTSVVRYDAGSKFAQHPHPDGEEILVLEGVFCDQSGRYPAGTFVLNPEGFSHAPFSDEGCTLLVKLRQSPGQRQPVVVNTRAAAWRQTAHPGATEVELYSSDAFPETIVLAAIEAGTSLPHRTAPGGEEIFVVSGAFSDDYGSYRQGCWLKYPPGCGHRLETASGCTLYVKRGHLGSLVPC